MEAARLLVVDADCLVAGTLTSEGATSRLLDLWEEGVFELAVCPRLLYEVAKTLLHPRVAGKYSIDPADVQALIARLGSEGVVLEDPEEPDRVVPDDPGDDYLVALALEAGARHLVTRDKHFQRVRVRGLSVITPGRMLRLLESQ